MKKILLSLLASSFFLISCGGSSTDIINPEAEFRYFYGATCPHCQDLNALVEKEDLFSQIAVEKKEVYYNTANRDDFLALTKELGLSEKDTGVPFVYDTISGKHAVGVGPALELFKSRLGVIESPTSETPGEETQNTPAPETLSGSETPSITPEREGTGSIDEESSQEVPAPLETPVSN